MKNPDLTISRSSFALFFILFLAVRPAQAITQEDFRRSTELNESATQKLKSGNLDGAEIDMMQAYVYSGQNPQIRKNLSVVYYEKAIRAQKVKKDFYEADRYLSQALAIEPNNEKYRKAYAAVLFYKAQMRAKEGYSEEAMRLYEKAAALDPQNAAAWGQASNFAWASQKLSQAQNYLDKAKAIDPDSKNVKILEDRLKNSKLESSQQVERSQHFVLSADASYMKNVGSHNVLYDLEDAFNAVSYKLSYYPKEQIPVVFYSGSDFYRHWNLPGRVNAFFDGKLRIPYYSDKTPVNLYKPILMHELTHAFVSLMTDKPIPQWLNEGLAQWVEGKQIDRKSKDAMMTYEVAKRSHDIAHLDSVLQQQKNSFNNTQMTLAYMKSYSFVDYLIEQRGVWVVLELIKKYSTFSSADEAFKNFYHQNLKDLEKDWLRWFERR